MNTDLAIESPDAVGRIVYLEVPAAQVVLFQAYFELYEGLGVVRTLDCRRSLVCLMTTESVLADCLAALEELRSRIDWRPTALPNATDRQRYIGYFSHASHYSEV